MHQFKTAPFAFIKKDKSELYGNISPSYYLTNDKIQIAYYVNNTINPTNAIMVFVHGAGAHCLLADYQNIGSKLKHNQITSYFIDIRGHGNSGGARGDCPKPISVWNDIKLLIINIKQKYVDTPIFLVGHSAGGGTIINYSTWKNRVECDGYIVIAPYLGFRAKSYRKTMLEDTFAFPDITKFVINMLTNGLVYGHKKTVFYNYSNERLKEDPLLVSEISVNMSKSCTLWNPKKQFGIIKKPLGLFIGSDDELFDPSKVTSYFSFLNKDIKDRSITRIIKNQKHLTILSIIDEYLVDCINKFRPTTAST